MNGGAGAEYRGEAQPGTWTERFLGLPWGVKAGLVAGTLVVVLGWAIGLRAMVSPEREAVPLPDTVEGVPRKLTGTPARNPGFDDSTAERFGVAWTKGALYLAGPDRQAGLRRNLSWQLQVGRKADDFEARTAAGTADGTLTRVPTMLGGVMYCTVQYGGEAACVWANGGTAVLVVEYDSDALEARAAEITGVLERVVQHREK
ncbi:hypothetical protein [Kitasatospora cheerisanensis]|uniref:Uncharacterized protein n=1 Tax=Kitasatospora cheerisanensis KCTC 2395 TaxID=1348663 RepID=A0A066YJY6_9ACTN|nr:hypothetical protein [Kitasatospora cheerisanensis]KDN81482.1 hypothetical protein KCH_67200 [Kitasatospora cheerisanensis KCTC 2395]